MVDNAKSAADDCSKECVTACKATVVKVSPGLALLLFILNILFPGCGTMISACACCGRKFNCHALAFGALQCYTSYFIFGWIWSIMHGYWLYKAAK